MARRGQGGFWSGGRVAPAALAAPPLAAAVALAAGLPPVGELSGRGVAGSL
ncbi:MAG: hypothetical protein LBR19_00720 [Bifidobacteriaceae bacterium]|nr:hypothetical protein [Bifidobacteriaceae bacterium]